MPLSRARRLSPAFMLSVVLVAGLVLPWRASAADPSVASCEPAYEGAQLLRQRGKLRDARDQAATCARDACPEVARRDCARWVDELGREIPTVVVVARDPDDHDVPGARLLVDGVSRIEVASGRAFELDPGSHTFRVERASGAPVEQVFTVYQGERDRLLRITLPRAAAAIVAVAPDAPVPASPTYATAPLPPAGPPSDKPSVVPAFVVAGISAAVLGTSAYLGLTGRQELSDLRSSCAPSCSDARVGPVRTKLVASDVALGVGVVGAALATYLFAIRGTF